MNDPESSPGEAGSADNAPIQGLDLQTVQETLEAAVCLPIQTLVLQKRPRLCRSRTPATVETLRQSRRIAARPRAANATKQAQNLLLKKLGMAISEDAMDSEIEAKFKEAFCGNLTARKKRTMQALLNGGFDLSTRLTTPPPMPTRLTTLPLSLLMRLLSCSTSTAAGSTAVTSGTKSPQATSSALMTPAWAPHLAPPYLQTMEVVGSPLPSPVPRMPGSAGFWGRDRHPQGLPVSPCHSLLPC